MERSTNSLMLMLERYSKLRLRDAIPVPHRYPFACRELGFILRHGYSEFPKSLQALVLDDAIAAFRLLPQMQTKSAVSAADFLIRNAEAALPKQKRSLAIKEFKQAKIATSRHNKVSNDYTGSVELPYDVLIQVFGVLDMQSLVSVGSVCRLWYEAASDNRLWHSHYYSHFGELGSSAKTKWRLGGAAARDGDQVPSGDTTVAESCFNWKDAFRRAYIGNPSRRFKYGRGYCLRCSSIVWLHNLRCPHEHLVQRSRDRMIEPIQYLCQVVAYIVCGSPWHGTIDTDSDCVDSDEEFSNKLWSILEV